MADCATCVSHVIDQNGDTIFHVSHQNHAVHLICLFPLFVNQGKVHVQPICY